jgi:hypothetical protein
MDYSGLFQNPDDIRMDRLGLLERQAMQQRQLGGSMSGLLGQVAAGTGGMLAEGIAGAFGLKTAQEAEAEKTNAIASSIDFNDPDSIRNGAKLLQEAGLTKAAVATVEKANEIERGKLDMEAKQLQVKDAELKFGETKKKIANNPVLAEIMGRDLSTKEAKLTALKEVAALGDPAAVKDLRQYFIDEAELQKAVSGVTYGAQQTVKDADGNLFQVTQVRPKSGIGAPTTVYTPMQQGGPAEPVGKVEIVSNSTGLTPDEAVEVAGARTGAVESATDWANIKDSARTSLVEASATGKRINQTISLLKNVEEVGGWDEKAKRKYQEITGTQPDDTSELQFLLEEAVLSQLKATFGAQFTEKEGQWLRSIMPNMDKSVEGNKAILQRIQKFAEDKAKQSKEILDMGGLDEYDKWLVGKDGDSTLDYVDAALGEKSAKEAPAADMNALRSKYGL